MERALILFGNMVRAQPTRDSTNAFLRRSRLLIGQILPSANTSTMTTSPLNHSQEVGEKHNNYGPEDAQDDTQLFLKATLQFLPRDGKRNLEADIRACQSDAEVGALMENLDTVLLRPFKTAGGKTEMVTPSSRYDTEDSVDQYPVVREQEQLPKVGLSREDNQCVLTSQRNKYLPPPSPNEVVCLEYVGKLIAAYIIPLSMGTVAG